MPLDLDEENGPGPFSLEPHAEYMRFMEETPFTFSFNYYKMDYGMVDVLPAGRGMDALSDYGKDVYQEPGLFKEFGIQCGDYYITSYQQGAMLVFGLKLEFESIHESDLF